VVGVSDLLQPITAFFAFSLIRITGWKISWMLISAPIFTMAVRRRDIEKLGEVSMLVESTDDYIYLMDREHRYLFINRKHLVRLSIPKDSSTDAPILIFIRQRLLKNYRERRYGIHLQRFDTARTQKRKRR